MCSFPYSYMLRHNAGKMHQFIKLMQSFVCSQSECHRIHLTKESLKLTHTHRHRQRQLAQLAMETVHTPGLYTQHNNNKFLLWYVVCGNISKKKNNMKTSTANSVAIGQCCVFFQHIGKICILRRLLSVVIVNVIGQRTLCDFLFRFSSFSDFAFSFSSLCV